MTHFTKGQKVFLVQLWSNDYEHADLATSVRHYVRSCVVHSCGKKQMVLHDVDGKFVGRNFKPCPKQWSDFSVILDGTKEDALAVAHDLAEAYRQHEIEWRRKAITDNQDSAGYVRLQEQYLERLQSRPIGVEMPYDKG